MMLLVQKHMNILKLQKNNDLLYKIIYKMRADISEYQKVEEVARKFIEGVKMAKAKSSKESSIKKLAFSED